VPNPKRALRLVPDLPDQAARRALAGRVHYRGSPHHKRNPGDFGLTPPAAPRRAKSLCDSVQIFRHEDALRLLREGLVRGLWSVRQTGEFPANVWAVTADGSALEAVVDANGEAHGYPLADDDPFAAEVFERWGR